MGGLLIGFAGKLTAGLIVGAVAGLIGGRMAYPWKPASPARGVGFSFVGLAGGVVIGLAYGLFSGHLAGREVGLAVGLAFGLLGVLTNAVTGVPGDLAQATTPQAVLARDRRATLTLGLIAGFIAGPVVGLEVGLHNRPAVGLAGGLSAGLVAALIYCTAETAWPFYAPAKWWLALRRRLPWRLMSFLDDAHHRGVLRQAGAVYQFRHVELQHRLATGRVRPDASSSRGQA